MPKVFVWKDYKYFFYSNEGDPLERCHVHVRKDNKIAKFWIDPYVYLDSSWGMTSEELNKLEKQVRLNIDLIKEKWNEYFKK